MIGTYLIQNPEKKPLVPGGAPAGGPPVGGPPAGGPPAGGPPVGGPPAGGPPAGGPPVGGPPAGGPPAGGPPAGGPGGPGGGMPSGPMAKEMKLVWDGTTALWTNEMSQEVTLEQVEASENMLKFTAMAGPAPIEWTLEKNADGYTATSHRGADIHGNPPVDTVCSVKKV